MLITLLSVLKCKFHEVIVKKTTFGITEGIILINVTIEVSIIALEK